MNRWVLAYAPLIERRLRALRKPHCGSVCIDETYIKIRGQWRYLYRAIDKHGTPVEDAADLVSEVDAHAHPLCAGGEQGADQVAFYAFDHHLAGPPFIRTVE